MIDVDFTKEYRLPISESLRKMRFQRSTMDCGQNIFVEDRLESEGIIKIYEYIGGTFYLPINANEMNIFRNHVVPIAGISVTIVDEEKVQIDKIFCEYGYDEYIPKIMEQIMNFADFYGLKVSILDLEKDCSKRNIRKCGFIDMKFWE